jgi:tRNA1Val (adenine37-N6)-methyltransferase
VTGCLLLYGKAVTPFCYFRGVPNSFFQFKQFTVRQDRCAMKVCTDACLFGAWVTDELLRQAPVRPQILDIGAGTGLLALMVAQKHPRAVIDAVEINPEAASQAAENFAASPWSDRLHVHPIPVQEFYTPSRHRYDVILANPPFYANDLKSGNTGRNLALHSEKLNFFELLSVVERHLAPHGVFAVLLPYQRTAEFIRTAHEKSLYPFQRVSVRQSAIHAFFRSMVSFSRTPAVVIETELTITAENGGYTPAFARLLQDFYLYL